VFTDLEGRGLDLPGLMCLILLLEFGLWFEFGILVWGDYRVLACHLSESLFYFFIIFIKHLSLFSIIILPCTILSLFIVVDVYC